MLTLSSPPRCLLLAAVVLACPHAALAGGFTFRSANTERTADARADADRFVAERLTAGLPIGVARARAARAGLYCRDRRALHTLQCLYAEPVHVAGGIIGEDRWDLRLAYMDGVLTGATLIYARGSDDL